MTRRPRRVGLPSAQTGSRRSAGTPRQERAPRRRRAKSHGLLAWTPKPTLYTEAHAGPSSLRLPSMELVGAVVERVAPGGAKAVKGRGPDRPPPGTPEPLRSELIGLLG